MGYLTNSSITIPLAGKKIIDLSGIINDVEQSLSLYPLIESKTLLIACIYTYLSRKTSDYAALPLRKSRITTSTSSFLAQRMSLSLYISLLFPRSDALRNGFSTSKVPLEEENPFYIGSAAERERDARVPREWCKPALSLVPLRNTFRCLSNVESST